jgi:hypothetical protein
MSTKTADRIMARAVTPPPNSIEITIPILLARQTLDELMAAYDLKPGPSPMLASLCDQLEEVVDGLAGVTRVGGERVA